MHLIDWNNREDRQKVRRERQEEIAAIVAGKWPRSNRDRLRYLQGRTPEQVKNLCETMIELIDRKDASE